MSQKQSPNKLSSERPMTMVLRRPGTPGDLVPLEGSFNLESVYSCPVSRSGSGRYLKEAFVQQPSPKPVDIPEEEPIAHGTKLRHDSFSYCSSTESDEEPLSESLSSFRRRSVGHVSSGNTFLSELCGNSYNPSLSTTLKPVSRQLSYTSSNDGPLYTTDQQSTDSRISTSAGNAGSINSTSWNYERKPSREPHVTTVVLKQKSKKHISETSDSELSQSIHKKNHLVTVSEKPLPYIPSITPIPLKTNNLRLSDIPNTELLQILDFAFDYMLS